MKIRIYHARILTMVEGEELFTGEIQIEGGKITYVGQEKKDASGEWDREIDAR